MRWLARTLNGYHTILLCHPSDIHQRRPLVDYAYGSRDIRVSRAGWGRVGSGWVGSGRVANTQIVFLKLKTTHFSLRSLARNDIRDWEPPPKQTTEF